MAGYRSEARLATLELTRFRGVCLAGKARRRAMPKTHPPYPAEYRRRMVEQVRAGRSLKELAREFEPSVESIRQWVRQAQLDIGERSDGLTSSEREELTRLSVVIGGCAKSARSCQ